MKARRKAGFFHAFLEDEMADTDVVVSFGADIGDFLDALNQIQARMGDVAGQMQETPSGLGNEAAEARKTAEALDRQGQAAAASGQRLAVMGQQGGKAFLEMGAGAKNSKGAISELDKQIKEVAQYSKTLNNTIGTSFFNLGHAAVQGGNAFKSAQKQMWKDVHTAAHIGKTLQIKFTSFNLFGGAEQSLVDVSPYSFTVKGSALTLPLPDVTGLTCAYVAGIAQLTWDSVSDGRAPDFEIRKGASWNSAAFVRRSSVPQVPTVGDGVYWVACHYSVADGYEIYSSVPAMITVSGAQIVGNVIASHDEQATGWRGDRTGVAIVHGSLQMCGTADLSDRDLLSLDDVIYGDGAAASGIYSIPVDHRIDIGRVAGCPVVLDVQVVGQPCVQDLLSEADVLAVQDVCGVNLGPSVSATPQIRLSLDGENWGDWQNWVSGSYVGRIFDARLLLTSRDAAVTPLAERFSFLVDVPDRVDSFTGLSLPATGLRVSFADGLGGNPAAAFNGGPNGEDVPNVLVTVLNGDEADTPLIGDMSRDGFFIQVLNGGQPVARTVNIIAQGY